MLTFHYIPIEKLEKLSSRERIDNILKLTRQDSILIIEGRLKSTEEAELIRETMNSMSLDDNKFNGIEFAVFHNTPGSGIAHKIKSKLAKWLIGDKLGLTIIGPASIIQELKQHPDHVEMHFQKGFYERQNKK